MFEVENVSVVESNLPLVLREVWLNIVKNANRRKPSLYGSIFVNQMNKASFARLTLTDLTKATAPPAL